MDLERVAACFPGATVTSVDGDGSPARCKVKLGPIALHVRRLRPVRRARRRGAPRRHRGQGQGQAGQRHGRRHRDRRTRPRRRAAPAVDVTTDLDDHRQAGAVRPRRHAGRLRQAAPAVRRLHRGSVRAADEPEADDARMPLRRQPLAGSAAGRRSPAAPWERPPRLRQRPLRRRRPRPPRPPRLDRSARRLRSTTRSTSAPRCCPCSSRATRPTPRRPWPGCCSAGCSGAAVPDLPC